MEKYLSNVRYERKGRTITTIKTNDKGKETRESKGYKFHNEAKRVSHAVQVLDGGLGMGVLKLVH